MHNILITGIGGTGVITISALIGMAAHLEGKGVSVLDMTGMSQKNGSVTSHVRIARNASDLKAQRIPTGEADLILGCDMLTAGAPDAIAKMHPGRSYALVNTFEQPTGAFAQDADWVYPSEQVRALIAESVDGRADFLDATHLATRLMGDAIAANLFMLGFAFQKGHVPLSSASRPASAMADGQTSLPIDQVFIADDAVRGHGARRPRASTARCAATAPKRTWWRQCKLELNSMNALTITLMSNVWTHSSLRQQNRQQDARGPAPDIRRGTKIASVSGVSRR